MDRRKVWIGSRSTKSIAASSQTSTKQQKLYSIHKPGRKERKFVPIENSEKIAAVRTVEQLIQSRSERERSFVNQVSEGREKDLASPFSRPYWPLAIPTLLCLLGILLVFTQVIDLGSIPFNWTLTFNVNLIAALAVLLAGGALVFARFRTNRKELLSKNSVASFIVLALVAAFFLLNILNFGTFTYTFGTFDFNALASLVLIVVMAGLALKGSRIAVVGLILVFLWAGVSIKDFNFIKMFQDLFTSEDGGRLLRALTPPNWKYFGHVVDPLIVTIQTAVASTLIAIIGALPLSVLAARNTSPHPVIYNIVRLIVNTIRSIPALILALLFIPFVGLGPGAGILGLGIHGISVLTKLYAESFESVKTQPIEALAAVGANGLKRFRWGVLPQAFPLLASYSIYSWESNVRDSTVVAFVGGGGIGFLLQANLALLDYANVAVILIALILTVMVLDRLSDFIRSKVI